MHKAPTITKPKDLTPVKSDREQVIDLLVEVILEQIFKP